MTDPDPGTSAPPRPRHLATLALAVVLAVALAVALAAWKHERLLERLLDLRYGATLPPARYPAPRDRAEANRQDLDYLAALPTVDRSFTAEAKARFEGEVAALGARAANLSEPQFLLGVAHAVAQAGNAHTIVDPATWRQRLNAAPLRFGWFPEGLHIVRATREHASLLGAQVLAIGAMPVDALQVEIARYISGTPEHARVLGTALLESPQVLHALHPDVPDDRLDLRVRGDDGIERTVQVAALAPSGPRSGNGSAMSSAAVPAALPGDWRSVTGSLPRLPDSLRDSHRLHFASRPGEGVLYLHLWRVSRGFDPEVGHAIDAALGPASDPPWRRIVLDLRFNGGGEYPTVYGALRRLRERLAPDGRLMILTDNSTFSGAIIVAALAKSFAGARATVIGEKAGDGLAFWAEGEAIELPNAKVTVNISTGYHDWGRGCREMRCYWPNLLYGVAAGSIDPGVPASWPFADYRRGIDPVLRRALE
jgi:hypothetical protein